MQFPTDPIELKTYQREFIKRNVDAVFHGVTELVKSSGAKDFFNVVALAIEAGDPRWRELVLQTNSDFDFGDESAVATACVTPEVLEMLRVNNRKEYEEFKNQSNPLVLRILFFCGGQIVTAAVEFTQ